MWYFAWLLGLPLAAAFAVLNGMWFELTEDNDVRRSLMSDIPEQDRVQR
ncbi:cytochrome bd-I oxidase subunit CydX [Pseudomonas sp. DTU_2021_1001937_2_SI_NGA_ILE_001]|nr:cytochrome bd-I oxidase subunit CydX [Pseudomonas sp. DTU_2021_1001937_2_SI_NGA_ILE_001]WNW12917.1 cytochrome bd-I oxidase subunit CydX [Pseudomonas sp. DTU_2021_1001937_2_SI_NGA_ILE_001]